MISQNQSLKLDRWIIIGDTDKHIVYTVPLYKLGKICCFCWVDKNPLRGAWFGE